MAKSKGNSPKNNKRKLKIMRSTGLKIGALLAALVVLAGFTGYAYAYRNKVLPNVFLGDVTLGGLSYNEAQNKISTVAKEAVENKVALRIGEKTLEEEASTLGLEYNVETSLQEVWRFGHSGSFGNRVRQKLRALFKRSYFFPDISGDLTKVDSWLEKVALEVDSPVQNANLEIRDKSAYIIEPKNGAEVNKPATKQRILDAFYRFSAPDLVVELETVYPQVTSDDARGLSEKAIALTKERFNLNIERKSFVFYPSVLGKWIKLVNDSEVGPRITFDEGKIRTYIEANVAPKVVSAPKDAKFSFADGAIQLLQPSVAGKNLNIEKGARAIAEELQKEERAPLFKLEMESVSAKINEELVKNVGRYGIKELIGSATTSFAGSSNSRVHNIKTGAQFINGIVLPPGEEFSTIKHLGSIDGASGYLQELVIKEDRTVPEFGGGLCQVSTTLFRAAMNSGLKITERHNHSYRVSYYEPPVGMDATIYSPKPDLRFVNNTAHHILIQSAVEGRNVTFNFFGTNDGRRVEISDPEIYAVSEPGETIYVDDPAMEPGVEKYLERARAGAKTVFYYKVFNGDGSLKLEQTFRSNYVAWPARIARGPEKPPEQVE
ncbi:MAG: VanW family protein [Patescibacteria group bacterium]|jgi:vancomycin resistance protein YoaR|nr:VanW family protein [bacterium]